MCVLLPLYVDLILKPLQHEKAYQKQDAIFVGAKRVLAKKGSKVGRLSANHRYEVCYRRYDTKATRPRQIR